MANNHSNIPTPTNQQTSSRRHQTQPPLNLPTTHAGPSTEVNHLLHPAHTPSTPNGPTLGMGMNASVGPRAQAQNRTTPNTRLPRSLSKKFPSIEAGLDFEIQRQPQNPQPTVHAPIAREPEPLYPRLENDSDGPGPVLPEEGQQASLPAPAPGPEGQSDSATARREQQDPQPTEVPLPNTPESAPRNQPIQRRRSHPQRNRAYSLEPRYRLDPPADIEIPADNRGIASYLPNIAPRIRAMYNAVGPWIYDIARWIFNVPWSGLKFLAKWIFNVLSAGLKFLPTIAKWIFNVPWAVFKFLMINKTSIFLIVSPIIAWWFWYLLVSIFVCPSVNAFCEVPYNPLRPMICPVAMCMEYPDPIPSGIVAAPLAPLSGEVVVKGITTAITKHEDSEYIRPLFRIPHALSWARKSLGEKPFHIRLSSMPDKEKETLITTLTRITQDMEPTIRGIKQFDLDYIHKIHTIHKHIRLFESVFKEIIDDYAGSAYPDRGFLRHHHHHHTSPAGWWEGIYAFVRRTTLWFANERDGDGAEIVSATTILQARFEEYINSSIPPLHSLNSSARGIYSALSLLQQRLANFSMHAADSLRNLHNKEKDKKDTGGGLSYNWRNLFQETEEKKEIEFSWIDADTALLKRCQGDLMDASRVLDSANFRISEAEIAIGHLRVRLHEISAKDMHDGWGSASVMIFTRMLSEFMGFMDGGEVGFEKLMKEAKEEEDKKWNKPMIMKN